MDTQEKDKVVDKGHENQDKNVVLYKSISHNLFSGSRKIFFLYAKTEKLASAIYLVTELLPEQNPIKERLRAAVADLIAVSLDFIRSLRSRADIDSSRQALLAGIQEVISLCRIALAAPGASRMNFSLLEREYGNLLGEAAAISPNEVAEEILGKELLTPEGGDGGVSGQDFYLGGSRLGGDVIKDRLGRKMSFKSSFARSDRMSFKSTVVREGNQAVLERQAELKKNRADSVLKVIREGGRVSVKEIAGNISDCSEKTIQRLLAGLVAEGSVRKEGERRWSMYSIAKNM